MRTGTVPLPSASPISPWHTTWTIASEKFAKGLPSKEETSPRSSEECADTAAPVGKASRSARYSGLHLNGSPNTKRSNHLRGLYQATGYLCKRKEVFGFKKVAVRVSSSPFPLGLIIARAMQIPKSCSQL